MTTIGEATRVHPLSYLYTPAQIGIGRSSAVNLLSITEPFKLAHSPHYSGTAREARRLALMGIAVRTAFEHHFSAEGYAASRAAHNTCLEASCLLKNYPPAEALADFNVYEGDRPENMIIVETAASLPPDVLLATLERTPSREQRTLVLLKLIAGDPDFTGREDCRSFAVCETSEPSNTSLDYRRKVLDAKQAALLNYIYGRMLKTADLQPRNIQAGEVKADLQLPIAALAELNNYAPPLMHSLIDQLLVNTLTGLPFNIDLPA
jgi:hypothetical protein